MEEYIAELESLLAKHLEEAETTGSWVDYVKVKYIILYCGGYIVNTSSRLIEA